MLGAAVETVGVLLAAGRAGAAELEGAAELAGAPLDAGRGDALGAAEGEAGATGAGADPGGESCAKTREEPHNAANPTSPTTACLTTISFC